MRAVDILMKKRAGETLTEAEIRFIIDGYVKGEIPDYQISALLMAIFFRGMTAKETAILTETMLDSGDRMDLSGIPGPFVDKHSTGGVGDKISLPLAPMVAACGVKVPMMSGRALGHTGGTLDKLESIPGYRTGLELSEFRKGLIEDGFAMTGQTARVVPADKKLYALRDVTATVESIPLITASILSKKVAEGADGIVFDVKCGSGAFMKTYNDAKALASSLVATGTAMGKRVVAVLTDMSQPLGYKVGNFLEIEETLDCLEGKGPQDVMELTFRLGAWMLVLGGAAETIEEGRARCEEAISSGAALERFYRNVVRQGGNVGQMLKRRGSWRSDFARELKAENDGYIESIDALDIGLAGVYLGVGRNRTEDNVSPTAGFIFEKKRGDLIKKGDRIAIAYGKDEASLDPAMALARKAVSISKEAPQPLSLVIEEITAP
ncbi:Pyrimidine-nucleoside phosphorylase [uncultured spirochete]|jgi:pyrimidine-nucleoside phosphorylase|uniref:thymidine phosphorylase n=1 Tax=uncultured spirochete TaxID=156406 RepID=A0A3P3XHN3_9SPIR|nr:Pyrimidine-nucleoside phosphorylase [uncultured spirochete]